MEKILPMVQGRRVEICRRWTESEFYIIDPESNCKDQDGYRSVHYLTRDFGWAPKWPGLSGYFRSLEEAEEFINSLAAPPTPEYDEFDQAED